MGLHLLMVDFCFILFSRLNFGHESFVITTTTTTTRRKDKLQQKLQKSCNKEVSHKKCNHGSEFVFLCGTIGSCQKTFGN